MLRYLAVLRMRSGKLSTTRSCRWLKRRKLQCAKQFRCSVRNSRNLLLATMNFRLILLLIARYLCHHLCSNVTMVAHSSASESKYCYISWMFFLNFASQDFSTFFNRHFRNFATWRGSGFNYRMGQKQDCFLKVCNSHIC